MAKSLIETYTDELEFLISLKQAVSILNNRIHDKLSWIAVEKLRTVDAMSAHPGWGELLFLTLLLLQPSCSEPWD